MQHRKAANAILYSIMFLSAALMTVIGAMLGSVAQEFSLSVSQSGLFYLMQFIGFTVFIILAGIISDRIGKRKVWTVTFIVLIISLFAFSMSQSYVMSLIILLFAGGFSGPLESIAMSLITDVNGLGAERQINTASVFYGLGAVAGPVLAGVCLHYGISWRTVYIALSVICLIGLGVSYLLKMPRPATAEKFSFAGFKRIAKDWRFMLVCVCVFLYCGAEGNAWGWMAQYMKSSLGFSVLKQSYAIGAFWLAIVVGRVIVSRVVRRVRPAIVIAVLCVGGAAVTFASAYIKTIGSEAVAWVIAVLMGLFYSAIWPVMVGQGVKRHQALSGTSNAIAIASGGLALAVVPAMLGGVIDAAGEFVAQIIPAFFFVAIIIIYVFIAKPEKE